MFDKTGSTLIAAIAAIVFSATMVGAAVGPARAVETAPVTLAAFAPAASVGIRG